MKSIRNLLQFIEQVLVYSYIWQIPFSWRIILDPSRSQFDAGFNEYMDISVYFGEVIILIALFVHILGNIIEQKSIRVYIKNQVKSLFHVERILLYTSLLILFGINIITSIDQQLSLISLLHFLLLIVAIFLISNQYVSRGTKLIYDLLQIFFFSIIFQIFLAFYQVINGSSIGIKTVNESMLSLGMLNVAKSHLFGHLVLRGYGTFSHPNVLATYALLVLVFMYSFQRYLFHVKRLLWYCMILLIISTIILTQSKLIILFLIFMIIFIMKNILISMFHVKHVKIFSIFLGLVLICAYISSRDVSISTTTRLSQANIQVGNSTPTLFGSGIGTYRISYDSVITEWWNYEPIHFVPYIIFNELGILPTFIFIMMIWNYLQKVPRETWIKIQIPVLFLIYIVSIDHYVWDIYQGSFIGALLIWIIHTIDKNKISSHNIIQKI
jgi:hypothetical protein